jgi:hypothetical protein
MTVGGNCVTTKELKPIIKQIINLIKSTKDKLLLITILFTMN